MRELRNPFLIRAAENIESEDSFLRLYNPDYLDIFDNVDPWLKPLLFIGAPGDGKTTLLKLFTPRVLKALIGADPNKAIRTVYQRLIKLGAIDRTRPLVIGAYQSCLRNYHHLDDLQLDEPRRDRLLFALLGARICLTVLSAIAEAHALEFPKGFERLKFKNTYLPTIIHSAQIDDQIDGYMLYQYAIATEKAICDALDSFVPINQLNLPGTDSLEILHIFESSSILLDDNVINARILIMLDDAQGFTSRQRDVILTGIASKRPRTSIWIAERREASTDQEIMQMGRKGRDVEPVDIGLYMSRSRRSFATIANDVTRRRLASLNNPDEGEIQDYLIDSITDNKKLSRIEDKLIRQINTEYPAYYAKINFKEAEKVLPLERIIYYRSILIVASRKRGTIQPKLFDFGLLETGNNNLEISTGIQEAARLFLYSEEDIPYFYGFKNIVQIASSNIEQLLWLSGAIYENIISNRVVGRNGKLDAVTQHKIIKNEVRSYWQDVQPTMPPATRNLINSIGTFAHDETFQPNAPYAPGVTGIAITANDQRLLLDDGYLAGNQNHRKVADAISRAIALNHLQPRLPEKNDPNPPDKLLLYLNRTWCVNFDLPLSYGGWRIQSLDTLANWILDESQVHKKVKKRDKGKK